MTRLPHTFDPVEAGEVGRALAAVAAADGALVAREVNFLDSFANEYGVGAHNWVAEALDEGRLARAVTDPAKRRAALDLCVTMAISDRAFTDDERFMIERIARAFAVPDEELASLLDRTPPLR
jgi:hypothetical protein